MICKSCSKQVPSQYVEAHRRFHGRATGQLRHRRPAKATENLRLSRARRKSA